MSDMENNCGGRDQNRKNTFSVNEITDNDLYMSHGMLDSTVFVFQHRSIGAEDPMGEIMLRDFFVNLCRSYEKPQYLIFTKRSVELCSRNSPVSEQLSHLASCEVSILVDYASVVYYNLKRDIIFGRLVSMAEILNVFMNVKKVIHL